MEHYEYIENESLDTPLAGQVIEESEKRKR
jgi:hypothetical protein